MKFAIKIEIVCCELVFRHCEELFSARPLRIILLGWCSKRLEIVVACVILICNVLNAAVKPTAWFYKSFICLPLAQETDQKQTILRNSCAFTAYLDDFTCGPTIFCQPGLLLTAMEFNTLAGVIIFCSLSLFQSRVVFCRLRTYVGVEYWRTES